MLKESPSSNFLKDSTGYQTQGTTFEFEYFREFESEFENNPGYESGIHMGSIHEINKRPKISCYYPFKCKKTAKIIFAHNTALWPIVRSEFDSRESHYEISVCETRKKRVLQ